MELYSRYEHDYYDNLEYHKYRNATYAYDTGTSNSLFVFFHGSIQAFPERATKTPLPVFYGVNYGRKICKSHTLNFFDKLLESYSADFLELSWFLETENIQQQDDIVEIVRYYIKANNIKDVYFVGSSGGGYISLLLASKFNQIAVFSNSQFNLSNHSQFQSLETILLRNNDTLRSYVLEEVLNSAEVPKAVYDFCNTSDYTLKHHDFMLNSLPDSWKKVITSIRFDGNEIAQKLGKRNHSIRFPNNEHLIKVLNELVCEK